MAEQKWRSGENTRLPLMWPCSEGTPVFLPPQTQHSQILIRPETLLERTTQPTKQNKNKKSVNVNSTFPQHFPVKTVKIVHCVQSNNDKAVLLIVVNLSSSLYSFLKLLPTSTPQSRVQSSDSCGLNPAIFPKKSFIYEILLTFSLSAMQPSAMFILIMLCVANNGIHLSRNSTFKGTWKSRNRREFERTRHVQETNRPIYYLPRTYKYDIAFNHSYRPSFEDVVSQLKEIGILDLPTVR